LGKPIDWDLIRQQYDQMIKYTTDLGAREPVWPVRSRYELAVGSFVIEVAAGDDCWV
jgi:hypothetical protein